MTSAAGRSSGAVGLGLGVGFELLEVRSDLGAIDCVELAIGLARLARLPELHQRLAEIIEAVGRAVAARVRAVVGEQGGGRGAGVALVELSAADQVVGVADPAMLGIGLDERFERADRVVVIAALPLMESLGVGLLARVRGRPCGAFVRTRSGRWGRLRRLWRLRRALGLGLGRRDV